MPGCQGSVPNLSAICLDATYNVWSFKPGHGMYLFNKEGCMVCDEDVQSVGASSRKVPPALLHCQKQSTT